VFKLYTEDERAHDEHHQLAQWRAFPVFTATLKSTWSWLGGSQPEILDIPIQSVSMKMK